MSPRGVGAPVRRGEGVPLPVPRVVGTYLQPGVRALLAVACTWCGAQSGAACVGAGPWVWHKARRAAAPAEVLPPLTVALYDLAAGTPCHNDPAFTSDHEPDRHRAALRCGGCAVRQVCAATGEAEQAFYVWGGRDRGAPPDPPP